MSTMSRMNIADRMEWALGSYLGTKCYDEAIQLKLNPNDVKVTEQLVDEYVEQMMKEHKEQVRLKAAKRLHYLNRLETNRSDPNWGYNLNHLREHLADVECTIDDVVGIYMHAEVAYDDTAIIVKGMFGALIKPERQNDSESDEFEYIVDMYVPDVDICDVLDHEVVKAYDPISAHQLRQALSQELQDWMHERGIKLYWRNIHASPSSSDTTHDLLNIWAPDEVVNGRMYYASKEEC